MKNEERIIYLGMISLVVLLAIFIVVGSTHNEKADLANIEIDTSKIKNIKNNIPKDVLDWINKERIKTNLSKEEMETRFTEYLYKYDNFDDELVNLSIDDTNKPSKVEISQAKADVEYLFKALKYGYAGYKYFGGDEGFLEAKKRIMIEIDKQNNNSMIELEDFKEILYSSFDFIQDGHFVIDGKLMCKDYNFFTTEDYELFKDDEGYYTLIDDEKKYVLKVNNDIPDKYIKLSINKDGKVVYRFVVLQQNDDKILEVNVLFKVRHTMEDIKITLSRPAYNKLPWDNKIYELQEISDVPVIKLKSFIMDTELEKFVKDAKKLHNKDLIIIDLRGNKGGNSKYASEWIENFTGKSTSANNIFCSLRTKTAKNQLINNAKILYEPKYIPQFEKTINSRLSKENHDYPGWTEVGYEQYRTIKNENLVVVLIDSLVSSAGESYVHYLQSLENVIFIGTNTGGAGNIGNQGIHTLPYSKIKVNFGITLIIDSDLIWRDGLGYFPDFWIPSNDALNRALKFISYYSR